ncbi:Gfo/Idh/MocA family protein [Bythopirellula polymerisocia]|uniref:Putative oxidoreductase YcjS n=1 Tax=Bythopirellula polymerisocia TaxID=2528003 RepID=A0A5C6CKK3_9BACT|nr:Gfo/Idh/MocA family oxidoreductase [Bythopirellula polymerisocia]TWU23656.1 putative oxidoreductase YcjS [Bythopirellula polymerisocia]
MKIGIIGAGTIGQKHAAAAKLAGAEIIWVVDANESAGQALAQEYQAKYSATTDELWSDESVAAVVIGVPNFLHQSLAIEALEARKDVLLEKPMALSLEECQQIAQVADATGRVLQIGFVHRYTGVGKLAKQIASSGKLGEIYSAKANLYLRRNVPGLGKWFTTKELSGGGALIDVGVHLIDLSCHIMDFPEVESVAAQTFENFGRRMEAYQYENMWAGPPNLAGICDVEDAAQALIRFTNGSTLELHVAWAGNYPRSFFPDSVMGFFGDQGGIAFELFGSEVQFTSEHEGKVADESLAVEDGDFFLDQFRDFQRSVETRIVRGADHKQACSVQAIVDAIYSSSRQQAALSL